MQQSPLIIAGWRNISQVKRWSSSPSLLPLLAAPAGIAGATRLLKVAWPVSGRVGTLLNFKRWLGKDQASDQQIDTDGKWQGRTGPPAWGAQSGERGPGLSG